MTMDPAQIEANVTLEQALRRANLLAAAAEVSQNITQIMDIGELLPNTVDIICDAYGFYYAGVFLIDGEEEFAVLRAGRGEPGRIMMENNHKLAVGGNSMIGACTALNEARISLDVDTEKVWYPNPVLPETRSEMALPLAIGSKVIGAVTVQSVESAAFSEEDISSLQAMANQLAIAIDNAKKRSELEAAHEELLQAKTFEAIATATGDAIHWIGNKAEPIESSVYRIRQDIQLLVCAVADILKQKPSEDEEPALAQLLQKEAAAIQQGDPKMSALVAKISRMSLRKLNNRLSLASVLEDLEIIEQAGRLIMQVKEEMIGPAREQAPRPTMADDVLKDTLCDMELPPGLVSVDTQNNLPLVTTDPVQLNRVFTNLIKNAHEAMEGQSKPQINISIRPSGNGDAVLIDVNDNGIGIPEEDLDKIWITFHTTKGHQGHAGLGLPACRLILEQMGGNISIASQPGKGTTATVSLPVYKGQDKEEKIVPGRGKVLIVDDYDKWQQFAFQTLKAAGYKVSPSEKDYQVDDFSPYDLILVDDILANSDAFKIMKRIKEMADISKVVVISSNPRVERTKDRKLMGIHNMIPKPYTQRSLLSEVKNTLIAIRSNKV